MNYESFQLPSNSLNNILVTYHNVLDALTALDSTKAMGTDDISRGLLKNFAATFCIPIHQSLVFILTGKYTDDYETHSTFSSKHDTTHKTMPPDITVN